MTQEIVRPWNVPANEPPIWISRESLKTPDVAGVSSVTGPDGKGAGQLYLTVARGATKSGKRNIASCLLKSIAAWTVKSTGFGIKGVTTQPGGPYTLRLRTLKLPFPWERSNADRSNAGETVKSASSVTSTARMPSGAARYVAVQPPVQLNIP